MKTLQTLDSKFQKTMQMGHSLSELQQRPTWLVSNLQDDKNNCVNVSISMKGKSLKAKLFGWSIQVRR